MAGSTLIYGVSPSCCAPPRAPLTLWGSSGRESGCRAPASASPVPSSTCPAGDSSSGHGPSPARLLAAGPAAAPLTLAAPRLPPVLHSPWAPSVSHSPCQHLTGPRCSPGPTSAPLSLAVLRAPLTLPAPPRCARLNLPAPSLRPGPRRSWSSRSGFVSRRKATQLTFPVRRARHPRPQSKHGWKAAVRPDAAAPHPAHVLRPRARALPGWQRQLSQQLGINL